MKKQEIDRKPQTQAQPVEVQKVADVEKGPLGEALKEMNIAVDVKAALQKGQEEGGAQRAQPQRKSTPKTSEIRGRVQSAQNQMLTYIQAQIDKIVAANADVTPELLLSYTQVVARLVDISLTLDWTERLAQQIERKPGLLTAGGKHSLLSKLAGMASQTQREGTPDKRTTPEKLGKEGELPTPNPASDDDLPP